MTTENQYRINISRRLIGLVLACAPFLLAAASLIAPQPLHGTRYYAGIFLLTFALIIAGLNFYLSFVRPLIHNLRNSTSEGYKFVSGFPVIGNFLAIAAVLVGFGSIPIAIVAMLSLVLDTAGVPWFVLCTWKDRGFWDTEIKNAQ
jgi:hypothetical protein